MPKIYLDYAATTPVDKKVLREMLPYFGEKFGNASSLHNFGKEASEAVEKSRAEIASFLNGNKNEVIFTSGATESNNWAIKGAVEAYWQKNKIKPHIITTQIEHHCVLESCFALEKKGQAEITYLPVGKDGIVKSQDVKKTIKKNTALVSIMYVNNEIGTVQPIAEIGKIIQDNNAKRESKNKIIFHTDATQAVNYFVCDVKTLHVDLMSLSGHKIYGPKGAGALYVKQGTAIKRNQDGGEQEFKLRAGTLNVPGIVGLGAAIKEIKNFRQRRISFRMKKLRDYLINKILKEIPNTRLNGSSINRSPNNINISFRDVEGESLILMLSNAGVAASTGSACSSGSLEPSHVLLALGLKPEEAHGSLRMTLGRHTTKREIDIAARQIKSAVEKLRKVSGNILEDYYKKHKP